MSFWEFFIVGVIGLLVIGPDKLPQTIKTGLVWFGRIKRMLNDTRGEFEKQLGVDEIRREIHNEQVMESLKSLKVAQERIKKEAKSIENQVSETAKLDDMDDEELFGEQHKSHPPAKSPESDKTTASDKPS